MLVGLIIKKYLSETQRNDLIQSIAEQAESPEALDDLLAVLQDDGNIPRENIPYCLIDYAHGAIYNLNASDLRVRNILQHCPCLREEIMSEITSLLGTFVLNDRDLMDLTDKISFFREMSITPKECLQCCDEESIERILRLVEVISPVCNEPSSQLSAISILLVGHRSESISSQALNVLRQQSFPVDDFVWDWIFVLLENSVEFYRTQGLVLWLRILSSGLAHNVSSHVVCSSTFWQHLQRGLSSRSHRERKFSLSIMKMTIKSLSSDFSNDLMTWSQDQAALLYQEWTRFFTLYEILAIDTSLHQADAASSDISRLISPLSLIHPSWGFCLLATGFQATTDSVQKFALNLFMQTPLQNLCTVKHGLGFFKDVFLPYAMLAPHFLVRSTYGNLSCPYGEALCNFLHNVLHGIALDEDLANVALAILQALKDAPECFDPARIFVCQGLVEGLNGRVVLSPASHGPLLVALFENKSEGELYQTCCQTLNLKILMHMRFDNAQTFLDLVSRFVRVNGYDQLIENFDEIRDMALSQKILDKTDGHSLLSSPIENQVIAAGIRGSIVDSDLLLTAVIASGMYRHFNASGAAKKYRDLIMLIPQKKFDPTLCEILKEYTPLREAFSVFVLDEESFWSRISEGVVSDDIAELKATLSIYKVFNNALESSSQCRITPETVLKLKPKLLMNCASLSTSSRGFYKLREQFNAEFFTTLSIAIERSPKWTSSSLCKEMSPESADFKVNMAMVRIVQSCLDKSTVKEDHTSMADFLEALWLNLEACRLQLNQKPLHLYIIEAILHPKLIAASIESPVLLDSIERVLCSVIKNAYTRRSLAPTMTSMMVKFQVQGNLWADVPWFPSIMVQAALILQPKSNFFRLEQVLGQFFDERITNSNAFELYGRIHGEPEVRAKVNIFAMLNSRDIRVVAHRIVKVILNDGNNLVHVHDPQSGVQEWRRTQLFAVLLSLCRHEGALDIDRVIALLEREPSPIVKIYIEWIIALLCASNPLHVDKLLLILCNSNNYCNGELPAPLYISFQRCLYLVAMNLATPNPSLFAKLLPIIVAGATSNKAIIRHSSLSLVMAAREAIVKRKITTAAAPMVEMIKAIYALAVSSNPFVQFKNGDAVLWGINSDLTLVGICGGVLKRVSDRPDIDFISRRHFDLLLNVDALSGVDMQLLVKVGDDHLELWAGKERLRFVSGRGDKEVAENVPTAASITPLQTKSGAWDCLVEDDSAVQAVTRSNLIVVASLVNKPPNLGGICRLCDVLGAGLLTLGDMRYKNNQQFKSVAVTADAWMPMIEVQPQSIRLYLLQKKQDGYTLIGLEQTDKSVPLNNKVEFPERTLLLLGKEKEGIPGDLLAELDWCVEINQVGVVRSMNIQTATAVVVHAYASQHC